MINSPTKRFILPFLDEKSNEPFASEVEAATVYAFAELQRNKGGGLILKQPEEKLRFITEMGYPIWLFPNSLITYILDGLDNFDYSFPYYELPNTKSFIESLESNSKTIENYMTFLSDYGNYFLHPTKEKQFSLRNLIVNLDFKKEFDVYRKEATEVTGQVTKLGLLTPTLQETTISLMVDEINKLQSSIGENVDLLPECLRRVDKTTGEYVTELDYAAEAVKDEANAKIKALEEIINPQIVNLNSERKHKIAKVTVGFDDEIDKLEKLKFKTSKLVDSEENKLKQYEQETKKQVQQNHSIYEKRWKSKSRGTKQEISELKKKLKQIEKNIKYLVKQKNEKIWALQSELDDKLTRVRQPLVDIEAARDAKMLVLKRETEKMVNQEKHLIEGLNAAVKLAEEVNDGFQMLGTRNLQLKCPALFYIPFYIACYQTVSTRRYLFVAPSMTSSAGFATKLKGAIGISKIKQMFTPRFKTIAGFIEKVQILVKLDSSLDQQIIDLGEKNNLLKNELARDNISKGLVYLKDSDWLLPREYQSLTNSLQN